MILKNGKTFTLALSHFSIVPRIRRNAKLDLGLERERERERYMLYTDMHSTKRMHGS